VKSAADPLPVTDITPHALTNTLPGYGSVVEWQRREGGVYGYTPNKEEYLRRLRRIEGQVRGLQRMVEEDKYCIDILTQVSAATRALQSVALGLMEDHLGHCVTQAATEGGDTAAAKVREASDAIARLVRS
jgi:DNA-binding FrmR family transcriptional regulator